MIAQRYVHSHGKILDLYYFIKFIRDCSPKIYIRIDESDNIHVPIFNFLLNNNLVDYELFSFASQELTLNGKKIKIEHDIHDGYNRYIVNNFQYLYCEKLTNVLLKLEKNSLYIGRL
jgi:hypothetical protein